MASLKAAMKSGQKTHRERSQVSGRKHLGLLEKKKDYLLRAKNFHKKENTIKKLKQKALEKNPDEFYFQMINQKTKDGVHILPQNTKKYTPDQIKLLKSQDMNYLNMKCTVEGKKVYKMQSDLHMIDMADTQERNHVFFVDTKKECNEFNAAEKFDTFPELLSRKHNIPTKKMLMDPFSKFVNSYSEKQTHNSYAALEKRIQRENKLVQTREALALQRQLMGKGTVSKHKYNNRKPTYKWKTHHHAVSQNSNSILNCNEQTYSWNTPCEKGYSVKPFEFNQLNYNNSFGKHTRSISSGSTNNKTEQKSKVTFSNEQMSISQSSGNHIVNSQNRKKIIALNKTPTDDEINNLWENVRQCLSAESSGRQAHSDIVPVSQNSHQSPRNYNNGQFYRSLSASSYRRNSFLENSTKQHNFFNQNNKGFIGVKNTNTMGVNMGLRSTNTTSIASRQSLLPQRAVQMIRNPKMTNKYDLNHNVDNLQNNALSSTASFLALEELCKNESLTPKQTDVFFHPSMQFKKKISNVDLSYEERCVMASLDRINKKLQEKEKVMGLYK